jgi:hypothetical protein
MEFSRSTYEKDLTDETFGNIQKQLKNQYEGLHQLKLLSIDNHILVELRLPLYSGSLVNIKTNKKVNEVPEPV